MGAMVDLTWRHLVYPFCKFRRRGAHELPCDIIRLRMRLVHTVDGIFVQHDDHWFRLDERAWDRVVDRDDLTRWLHAAIAGPRPARGRICPVCFHPLAARKSGPPA